MSKKKRNITIEKEGYIVKYNYQKPDGYWEIGKEEKVLVSYI